MLDFVRTKVMVIILATGLVGGTIAAVALAAPGGGQPRGADITETETVTATHPAEATEAETPEATEIPEATETPEVNETPEVDDGVLGVPTDSPACAGTLDNPNPHDTDSDGDGCREVELPDGTTINLPDPAADAHDGNPGAIGEQHRSTGEPPFGHGPDHGEGETPEPTETD